MNEIISFDSFTITKSIVIMKSIAIYDWDFELIWLLMNELIGDATVVTLQGFDERIIAAIKEQ